MHIDYTHFALQVIGIWFIRPLILHKILTFASRLAELIDQAFIGHAVYYYTITSVVTMRLRHFIDLLKQFRLAPRSLRRCPLDTNCEVPTPQFIS